jgi:hypothetical protein
LSVCKGTNINKLLKFNSYAQDEKVDMIRIWFFIRRLYKFTASRYLLSLLLSMGTSDGITENDGLSDIGTLAGTMGAILTPKCWRAADVERADEGCSIELVGREDRMVIVERAGRGCSTKVVDWDGRLADIERVEDGCSTELFDRDDRPTDEERADGGCSWLVRTA